MNLLFAIFYGACSYFYILSMIEDPGYVPKSSSRSQQKAIIDELLGLWKFDDQNFCVQCMIRTPVRSKHCRRCKRCVAKHDQYGPLAEYFGTYTDSLVIVLGSITALASIISATSFCTF